MVKPLDKQSKYELRQHIARLNSLINKQDHLITVQQSKIIALEQGVHHSAQPLADLCRRIEEWRKVS